MVRMDLGNGVRPARPGMMRLSGAGIRCGFYFGTSPGNQMLSVGGTRSGLIYVGLEREEVLYRASKGKEIKPIQGVFDMVHHPYSL